MSCCCVADLRSKEVINIKNGCRIGYVGDVEINIVTGCLVAIIVYPPCHCFGLFSKPEDIRVCWEEIEVIGDQTILVCIEPCCEPNGACNINQRGRGIFENLFKF